MPSDLTKDQKSQKACTAMIFIGLGEILGSFINGQFIDRLGLKKYCLVNVIEVFVSFLVMIIYNINDEYSFGFAATMVFLFGISDSGTVIFTLCASGF